MNKYIDRKDAGRILADQLREYSDNKNALVLALPRGGVPVAFEVAMALHLPLDVFIVRKLGVPTHPELAMGAIAMGGTVVFNYDIVEDLQISHSDIESVIAKERKELQRREEKYRGNRPFPEIKDKTIILVDDGIATGATMRAAIKALYEMKAGEIIVAVPVADTHLCDTMSLMVDGFVCPMRPEHFHAVGAWYENFGQTEDAEVHEFLKEAEKK